jgi:hypothetical protein
MNYRITMIILVFFVDAQAEVLVPFQPSNKVKATVSVDIAQDKSTRLYTYTYTLANALTSEQRIDNFVFEIDASTQVVEATAPKGWSFGRYTHKNLFAFSSTEGITEEHVFNYPNGGFEIRSPYDIKPGASLCCFIFKTYSPPVPGNAYIQGYTPTPQSRGAEYEPDFAAFGIKSISIEDNSFVTTVNVPKIPLFDGNRGSVVGE